MKSLKSGGTAKKSVSKWLLTVVIGGLLLAGCAGSLAADVTPPPNYQPTQMDIVESASEGTSIFPLLPPDPAAGKVIYVEKCEPCHGSGGMGDGVQAAKLPAPPPPLGKLEYSRTVSPAGWFQIVTRGNIEKFMPGFGPSLSDRQRWDVVAYLLTLSIHPDQVAAGQQVFQETCQTCHGDKAAGIAGKAPALDREAVLQKSLDDITEIISRGKGKMPAAGEQLDETQKINTATYIQSLVFSPNAISGQPNSEATAGASAPEVAPGASQASSDSLIIAGRVINGSGKDLPPGLPVKLTGYDAMQPVFSEDQISNSDGKFSFNNIPQVTGRVFLISASYNGIEFFSDVIQPDQTADMQNQFVRVYESSTDISQLKADRLHLFFEFLKPDVVQVVQMYVLNNPTNYLLTAEKTGVPVISFPLPDGAANLEFQNGKLGERFIVTEDGFGDTQGIPPGSGTQILFAYDLPYKSDLHLLLKVPLLVESSNIMLPSQGVTIKSSQLQDMGVKQIQGTDWRIYASDAIPTGTELDLLLMGKPKLADSVETEQSANLTVGLVALGLTLIVGAGLVYRWNISRKPALSTSIESSLDGASTDAALDAIIALDDLYQAGKIPRSAYEERRSELKDRLRGAK